MPCEDITQRAGDGSPLEDLVGRHSSNRARQPVLQDLKVLTTLDPRTNLCCHAQLTRLKHRQNRSRSSQLRRGVLRLLEHRLKERVMRRLRHGHGARYHRPELNTRRLGVAFRPVVYPPEAPCPPLRRSPIIDPMSIRDTCRSETCPVARQGSANTSSRLSAATARLVQSSRASASEHASTRPRTSSVT